ncbi:MAG: ABC transporter substrate-binding protein [Deltaproteobacteria bacterium]|nr:ABC transporter substrate-binding protein [Deltaproteobacteria bacterium]
MPGRRILAPFLIILTLAAVAARADAQKPDKVPRVGLLWLDARQISRIEDFRTGLRELGYVEGRNIVLEYRDAKGDRDQLPKLAVELARLKVDVIVADAGRVIESLKETTKSIPIVIPVMTDPLASGFVADLTRPGGNITGLTNLSSELSGKRLELLKEAVPRVSRVAVLWHKVPAHEESMTELMVVARSLGVHLDAVLPVEGPGGLRRAFEAATKPRPNGLIVVPSPRFRDSRKAIVKFTLQNRLPAIFPLRDFAELGGLMAYGPDFSYNYRRAAVYVDKILKGVKPGDLPVENPMKFELVINLKAAKALRLKIPPEILMRANEVIR